MGAYVNPEGETKEQWLEREGLEVTRTQIQFFMYDFEPANEEFYLPVVLIDNGYFTAGAIAYDARERDAFLNPADTRPKRYFTVELKKLLTVSEELPRYLEIAKKRREEGR